jgi:septin family protein
VILVSSDPSSSSNNNKINPKNGKYLTMALAGNANVGKSVRFNQLTCLNQFVRTLDGAITLKIGSITHELSRVAASTIQVKQTK